MARVLLVEDDPAIRETASLVLERHGFEVDSAADGDDGLAQFERSEPDVALLDVMLPGIDGVSLCRLIRERSDVAIVMLTARSDPLDIVAGLEAGADDYVTKPFDGPVLAARLRAVLRRAKDSVGGEHERLSFDDLEIDVDAMEVEVGGQPVRLTATEARLLIELARNAGIVLSRDTLLERVWDYEWSGDTRLVDVHVQRLRAKIGGERIETVRGVGYKLPKSRSN
ncbi:MAG: response regulator [Solirubrobacterales bacterium]